jgi:hypothetical protein
MQTAQTSPKNIVQHHLDALGKNDMEELMKDYTEQSELWTPDGPVTGLKAISSFFSYAFTLFPKDKTKLEIKKMIDNDSKVYFVWAADSPAVIISFASDSFEVRDEKIVWQTTAFQMVQK